MVRFLALAVRVGRLSYVVSYALGRSWWVGLVRSSTLYRRTEVVVAKVLLLQRCSALHSVSLPAQTTATGRRQGLRTVLRIRRG